LHSLHFNLLLHLYLGILLLWYIGTVKNRPCQPGKNQNTFDLNAFFRIIGFYNLIDFGFQCSHQTRSDRYRPKPLSSGKSQED
jgi:hypothetical protein